MAVRAAVAVVAVVLLAYLAVALRDIQLVSGALRDGGRDPAAAIRDLEAARLLNPDPAADVTRAFFLDGTGRGAQARALLSDVVRREPENLGAWRVLGQLSQDADPALARRAQDAQRRLDPLG